MYFEYTRKEIKPQTTQLYEVTKDIWKNVRITSSKAYIAEQMYKYVRDTCNNEERYYREIKDYVNSLSEEEINDHVLIFRKPYETMKKYTEFLNDNNR